MSHKYDGTFERRDLPVRKAKRVAQMDNLDMDVMAATAAGLSYGHYKVLHPETQRENDDRRQQVQQDLEKRQAEKAAQAPTRSRSRTGAPLTYKKTCPICGQKFETKNVTRTYCGDACKRKLRAMRDAANRDASRVKKVCPVCRVEFMPAVPQKVYCNIKCRNKAHNNPARRYDRG